MLCRWNDLPVTRVMRVVESEAEMSVTVLRSQVWEREVWVQEADNATWTAQSHQLCHARQRAHQNGHFGPFVLTPGARYPEVEKFFRRRARRIRTKAPAAANRTAAIPGNTGTSSCSQQSELTGTPFACKAATSLQLAPEL